MPPKTRSTGVLDLVESGSRRGVYGKLGVPVTMLIPLACFVCMRGGGWWRFDCGELVTLVWDGGAVDVPGRLAGVSSSSPSFMPLTTDHKRVKLRRSPVNNRKLFDG